MTLTQKEVLRYAVDGICAKMNIEEERNERHKKEFGVESKIATYHLKRYQKDLYKILDMLAEEKVKRG